MAAEPERSFRDLPLNLGHAGSESALADVDDPTGRTTTTTTTTTAATTIPPTIGVTTDLDSDSDEPSAQDAPQNVRPPRRQLTESEKVAAEVCPIVGDYLDKELAYFKARQTATAATTSSGPGGVTIILDDSSSDESELSD